MIRLLLKLAGIFVLAYTAVHLGYAKLEKDLLSRSCFTIVGLPTPETPTQKDGNKRAQPSNSVNTAPQLPPLEGQSSLTENEEDSASTLSTNLATNGQAVDNENKDFQIIIRRNIFQLTQQELPATREEVTTVVEKPPNEVQTALNLTLLGTVMGDNRTSRAIIVGEKKNEQKLYQVGDAVQGAIIESVERGKVILDVFGARETLLMKKREGGGLGRPFISRSPRPPRPNRPVPVDIEDEELEDIEDLEDLEEDEEDEALEEKRVRTRRRPPSIRPHRRINFRRNPIRNTPSMDKDVPIDEPNEEVLLDQDDLPEDE